MSSLGLEIVLVILLILANGILAMAEIAIVSSRRARLQQLAEMGDEKAQKALDLIKQPADFLSTVQVGITLIGVLAGAFGGATIAERLAIAFREIPALAPYSGAIALGLVVTVITYLSLIIGELAPKRLALNNPEAIATLVAGPMDFLRRLTSPIVRFLSLSTDFVLRLLGVGPDNQPEVTEEEIKILIAQGTQAGIFEEAEQDMVEGVFRLGDRRVGTIMTPRHEIIWLDLDDPAEENQRKISEGTHSRYPVAREALDNIEGIVLAKDLLARSLTGEPFDLLACLRTPLYVPESMAALKVLEMLKESTLQMVLVIDEFGGLEGMVTVNDILESIVGDFPMVGETVEPEVVQREDGTWLVDGMLPVDEFSEIFHIPRLPNVEKGYFQTVSGFIMDHLGRIPSSGDHFEWNGLEIEVMDMDGFRVDKVLVVPESERREDREGLRE